MEPTSLPTLLIDITTRNEIWCCSNGQVRVIRSSTISPDNCFELREVGRVPLSAGCAISSGVWVARGDLPYLYLYHVHKRILIQTYDLSKAAGTIHTNLSSSFGVSSLNTINNLLVVGTTIGVVIVLPLPKLPVSTPSIVGPARAAIHGPTQRVQFCAKVKPRFLSAADSSIHHDSPLLLALGIGQREPAPALAALVQATHVTLWRCCT